MKLNAYMTVAAVLVGLSLLLGLVNLLRGANNPPIPSEVPTTALSDEQLRVIEAHQVLDPMFPNLSAARSRNPFNLEEEVATRAMRRLPPPPPPLLVPPQPPMLPLPGEWGE